MELEIRETHYIHLSLPHVTQFAARNTASQTTYGLKTFLNFLLQINWQAAIRILRKFFSFIACYQPIATALISSFFIISLCQSTWIRSAQTGTPLPSFYTHQLIFCRNQTDTLQFNRMSGKSYECTYNREYRLFDTYACLSFKQTNKQTNKQTYIHT